MPNKYEKLIYATFTQEFRLFSSKRNTFKAHLKQLNDSLNGIQIVEIEGITLTDSDIAQIS